MWTSHHRDHEVRAPAVHGAQEPAERLLVVEVCEARPGLVGRRARTRAPGRCRSRSAGRSTASVALPKTYHQLAGARAARGGSPSRRIGCAELQRARRASRLTRAAVAHAGQRRLHTGSDSVGSWPPRTQSWPSSTLYSYSIEPARRRPRGARAVGVVDAAVARAHEEARLREPAHRAAEVRAVDRRRPGTGRPSMRRTQQGIFAGLAVPRHA